MTASSELRAAATKLRGQVAAALEEMRTNPYWEGDPTTFTVGINNACGGEAGELAATFSPPMAERLATALDLLADRWDTFDPHLDAMHQHDETAVGHHLLVIARQINGGAV